MFEIKELYTQVAGFFTHDLEMNTLMDYFVATGIIGGGLLVVLFCRGVVFRMLGAWVENFGRYGRVDRVLASSMVRAFLKILPLIPVYFGLRYLSFSAGVTNGIRFVFFFLFTFSTVRFLANFAVFLLDAALRSNMSEGAKSSPGAIALTPIVRTIVWALGLTFVLDNLGFQITSIIAGLGIMGVAIGLAGQAILADFFSYLVILMDSPFMVGDYVTSGTVSGTVEHIGIKTTRIRTTLGEVRICPNGELVRQNIGNLGPAKKRARVITFGVTYETPVSKVKAISDIVREVAGQVADLTVDRVFFLSFGDSSLDFEVALSVPGNDGIVLLQAVHDFNILLMERFEEEHIDFAYPVSRVISDPVTPPVAT